MPIELVATEAKRQMEVRLSRRLHEVANQRIWFDERPGPIRVDVRFDDGGRVLIDLGPGLGKLSNTPDMEDLESLLINTFDLELADQVTHHGISFLFDGKDMYFYHPEERPPPPRQRARMRSWPRVVLSPGHGHYRLYGQKDSYSWVFQRTEQHGVQEDVITMEYARLLKEEMSQRPGMLTPRLTRLDWDLTHAETRKPWSYISARYYLAWEYPENPEIWHSLPEDKTKGRERLEDIRSRPLFANHIGADALVHLHTNAEPSGKVRGARAYHYKDSPESKKLADSLLCGLKEVIRAQPKYKDFQIDDESRNDGDYGENRLAAMPSALVELAFHSNEKDAAALLDENFKRAAVSGLTKGVQLYMDGEGCEPFVVTEVGQGSGYIHSNATMIFSYKGSPRPPVIFNFEEIGCNPSAAECMSQQDSRDIEPSPMIYYGLRCPGVPGVRKYRLTLIDRDGVASSPVEDEVNCKYSHY